MIICLFLFLFLPLPSAVARLMSEEVLDSESDQISETGSHNGSKKKPSTPGWLTFSAIKDAYIKIRLPPCCTCNANAYTIIHEIFVVNKFSCHPKRRNILTRILFTNSIIRSEYMVHT